MVRDCASVGLTPKCVPLWILLFCHRVSTEVLRRNIYFLDGSQGKVTVLAPALTNGTEFSWEWTPHHSGHKNTLIATVTMPSKHFSWKNRHAFWEEASFGISMNKRFQNAGVFSFKQTKPALALLSQFDVFGVKVSQFPLVPAGFDVCSSCEISHLPKSVVLQWEKKGDPSANTTLLHNNTTYIIIHNANLQCNGQYACNVRSEKGQLLFTTVDILTVTEETYKARSTLYRGVSNSSEVELICQTTYEYNTATWSWAHRPSTTLESLASVHKHQSAHTERETDRRRFTVPAFNGKHFPLSIAPLKFEDSGIYICYLDGHNYGEVTLVNIQVSVEPPGGVSGYQPVVLNCEVSMVTETLTLAWLRMEGHRGVQVKQEVLTGRGSVRNLSLTLPGLSADQLHWECAVFSENMLRARVPLHLTLLPGNTMPIIIAVCVGAMCVAMLISALLLYYRRRTAADLGASSGTSNQTHVQLDAIYSGVTALQEEGDTAPGNEVLYSSVLLGASSADQTCHPAPVSEGQTESVVYSVLNIK